MTKVDVIVTNHDMVLADLALGGGAVLPDPRETIYLFDEGHHLPDKAIGHFAHFTRLRSTADWLGQVEKNLTKLLAQHPLPGDLGRLIEQVPEQARELRTQQQFMFSACEQLADFRAGEDMEGRERPRHRFEGGLVPEHLRELGIELKKGFAKLTDVFTRLTGLLKQAMDDEGSSIGLASHQAEEWYPLFGSLLSRAQGNWELWTAFTVEDPEDSPPMARWLTLAESGAAFDIEVNASPILAAETLRRNLWNVAYGALVTSATLTALGTFDRFRMRSGLPKAAVTAVVPSPFHHADAGVLESVAQQLQRLLNARGDDGLEHGARDDDGTGGRVLAARRGLQHLAVFVGRGHGRAVQGLEAFGADLGGRQAARDVGGDVIAADVQRFDVQQAAPAPDRRRGRAAAHVDADAA